MGGQAEARESQKQVWEKGAIVAEPWGLRATKWIWRAEFPRGAGLSSLCLSCLLGLIPWELQLQKPRKYSCCGQRPPRRGRAAWSWLLGVALRRAGGGDVCSWV